MNPHFQPYTDLSTPNTPSPDGSYTNLSGTGASGPGANGNGTSGGSNNGGGASGGCVVSNGNSMVHNQNGHPQQMPMDGNGQTNFHHLNNNSPVKHCAGCGGKIVERYFLHALDRYWHNSCLKCYCCGAMLADIGSSCYTRSGMILCKADYSRMFGTTACSACGQTIAANEFVMRTTSPISNQHQQQQQQQQQQQTTSPASILDGSQKHFPNQLVEHHVFHLKCFACSKCASQLRPGDRYYMIAGSLVCEQDWHKLLKNAQPNPPLRKGKVGRPRRSRD